MLHTRYCLQGLAGHLCPRLSVRVSNQGNSTKLVFVLLSPPRRRAEKAGAPRALLTAMDSRDRGLGQATFKDFVEFMGGESRGAAHFGTSGERGGSPTRGGLAEKVGHVEAYHDPLGSEREPIA